MEVWSLSKRIAELRRVAGAQNEGTYPLHFKGSLSNYNIFKVPIDMPVYRLSNGRTIARQREYVVKHRLPSDFFTKDPESIEALQAQDEILRGMAKDEGLYEYFGKSQTVQDQPIVLDEYGYIVNGNRRICAMRMLLEANFNAYSKYEYVRVIVLPNCTEEDIVRLEAQLQIQPDIKADYSWIAEALLFKKQMELFRYDMNRLVRIHGKKNSDIEALIDMVDYADEYLSSRDWVDQYSKIEKSQEAFSQLRRYRKNFRDPNDQEIFKEIVFSFIDNPDDAPGRIYSTVKDIADNLEAIKATLQTEFDVEPDSPDEEILDEKYDILTPVVEDDTVNNSSTNEGIIELVKTSEKPEEVREAVVGTILLEKKKKIETKSKNAFRKNIQNAYSSLLDARTCHNENSDTQGVIMCLENIEGVIKDIKGLLK